MFNKLIELYGQLPEGAKQIPAAILLMTAITTYVGGKWMSGAACQALRDADQKETTELRKERDEYKAIAFESVRFLNERAKQSVKINDQATATDTESERKPEPTVATVKVPITPVTKTEKQEIEKQPQDAQPKTLERSLNASKTVLEKNDINNATVTAAQYPKKPEENP